MHNYLLFIIYYLFYFYGNYRYEDNDRAGVGSLMTMNIGAMQSETSGPIGKDNCVEMIVPGQIG